MFDSVFWSAFIFVAYTYLLYPLLIGLASRLFPADETHTGNTEDHPDVTVVVTVCNELGFLKSKLDSLRNQTYPHDKMTFLFVSDGSTDGSNEYLSSQDDITLIENHERMGKPGMVNLAIENVHSSITVMMDARQIINPDAVLSLANRLAHPDIGAVSGELVFYDPESHTGEHVGLYWRYEKWIRKSESRFYSTAGATGAIYAFRTEDFVPLAIDTLLDDFEVPMNILRKGKRVVFDSHAIAYDKVQEDSSKERVRKIRTLAGNYQSLMRNPWYLSPFINTIFIQYVSHKLFRLLVPYALIIMFLSSIFADGTLYSVLLWCQALFYLAGVAGIVSPSLKTNRLVSFISTFIELNYAAVAAFYHYYSGAASIKWERT